MYYGLKQGQITQNIDNEYVYAPNFEKVGRAYCFWLVCLSVCVGVSGWVRLLTFEP